MKNPNLILQFLLTAVTYGLLNFIWHSKIDIIGILIFSIINSLISNTLTPYLMKDFNEHRATKMVDKGESIGLLGEYTITLSEEYLINQNELIETKMYYSAIKHVVEAKEYIYILCKYSTDACIVPICSFESIDQKNEFLNHLNVLKEKASS